MAGKKKTIITDNKKSMVCFEEGADLEACAAADMAAIPKGRIKKDWQVQAMILKVPKDWQLSDQGGKKITFKTSVKRTVKNIYDITETVDANLEFTAIKMGRGYQLKECKVDLSPCLDPIQAGHEIMVHLLDKVAEPDYTEACWE